MAENINDRLICYLQARSYMQNMNACDIAKILNKEGFSVTEADVESIMSSSIFENGFKNVNDYGLILERNRDKALALMNNYDSFHSDLINKYIGLAKINVNFSKEEAEQICIDIIKSDAENAELLIGNDGIVDKLLNKIDEFDNTRKYTKNKIREQIRKQKTSIEYLERAHRGELTRKEYYELNKDRLGDKLKNFEANEELISFDEVYNIEFGNHFDTKDITEYVRLGTAMTIAEELDNELGTINNNFSDILNIFATDNETISNITLTEDEENELKNNLYINETDYSVDLNKLYVKPMEKDSTYVAAPTGVDYDREAKAQHNYRMLYNERIKHIMPQITNDISDVVSNYYNNHATSPLKAQEELISIIQDNNLPLKIKLDENNNISISSEDTPVYMYEGAIETFTEKFLEKQAEKCQKFAEQCGMGFVELDFELLHKKILATKHCSEDLAIRRKEDNFKSSIDGVRETIDESWIGKIINFTGINKGFRLAGHLAEGALDIANEATRSDVDYNSLNSSISSEIKTVASSATAKFASKSGDNAFNSIAGSSVKTLKEGTLQTFRDHGFKKAVQTFLTESNRKLLNQVARGYLEKEMREDIINSSFNGIVDAILNSAF